MEKKINLIKRLSEIGLNVSPDGAVILLGNFGLQTEIEPESLRGHVVRWFSSLCDELENRQEGEISLQQLVQAQLGLGLVAGEPPADILSRLYGILDI